MEVTDSKPPHPVQRLADQMLLSCPEAERRGRRAVVLMVDGDGTAAIAAAGYGEDQEAMKMVFGDILKAATAAAEAAGVGMSVFPAPGGLGGQG